jgi:anti-anti-sigma factor
MFKVELVNNNSIKLIGRFTAADVAEAETVFNDINSSTTIDFSELNYISSAGLSVLLKVQKKLSASNQELTLINMSKMVRDIFHYVGFETIFKIE